MRCVLQRTLGHGSCLLRMRCRAAKFNDSFGLGTRQISRLSPNSRNRRNLVVARPSGGGRLTERTPAVQPRRREGVKVPLKRPCRRAREPAKLLESGHSTFPAVDHILARSWRDAAIAFLLTEKSHRGYTRLRTMSANTRRRAAPNIGGRHGYRCCPLAARTRA